ncbi:ABC transporter substrate-binding protein [Brachybacterium sp. NBEC-018]|uniref:peptide ABC transporter substrate-binding protein n=1 Tax=Brachybacterium sp. NBEC-018 TaxID=2996004 RepID=UPI00217538DE|nr:ABC transporter substrate-binding protein [Brachybacterium sp. NBEC-018]UVY83423.1 ABC transporter substrate-binding protein [Brachybacterium sp. NBEC-018]
MALSRRSMMLGTAATGVAAATLAACTGGSSGGSGGSDGGSGSGEMIFANTTEPENPLIPTNTGEVGGGRVVTSIFAGLVYYTADGKAENDLAESIESEDNQHWTIKIKSGLKFSDDSDLTAQSFVDAWNFGANAANAQLGQYFFEPIEGYADLSKEDVAADAKLPGLEVVDDTTFTVQLVSAQSDFPNRLGYSAYMPLPASAFGDIEAFGEKPVSNGPYMVDSWTHDKEIVLVPNPNYDGPRKAKNSGITFVVYDSDETMYNDLLADNVDVIDQIPTSQLQNFESDLGDRAVNDPGAVFQSFTLPGYDPNFEGEAGALRREAISRAIDRKSICDSLFFGTRTPATDFVAPVIPGGGATDIEGADVLEFDEAKAKDLWAQAEAKSPFKGPLTLAYNADGPHADWVEAVCNSLKNTLGIEANPTPFPAFGEMREQIRARKLMGTWRSGWQADYPSMYNFLGPLYGSGAADGNGSNDGDYKNPEFDQLLSDGLAAASEDEAIKIWKQAEALIMRDLPVVPLWYQNTFGGYSSLVSNVEYGWDTVPLYYEITK